MTVDDVRTKVPSPFRVDSVKHGTTARLHGVNRVEINLKLGFGVTFARLFTIDGIIASSVPNEQKSAAVHCLVILLGGKRLIVQPENDRPTCTYARVYLNERIYGTPIGLVTNVERLDHPILDVTSFFGYLGQHDFDVKRVYEVVNRPDKK